MTCIIGYIDKKNNKTYMGCDSCASTGNDKIIRKDKKVFKSDYNPNFLIGFTSSYRMGQLLMYADVKVFPSESDLNKNNLEVNHKFMVTQIIPKIQQLFEEGGFGDRDEGGEFLIAYKNQLYKIYSDFQVEENTLDYNSCGCGEYYAEGSLFSLQDSNKNIIDKIHTGLQSATYFSGGVDKPFYIMNTENDETLEFKE